MRSTFSVSTWTWALAGCLAFFLGCSQGEGDRCEIDSDCSGDLKCTGGSEHNRTCVRLGGSGAGGSTGQGGTTGTSTETADASLAPVGGEPDASVAEPDTSVAGPDASVAGPDTAVVD